MPVYNTYANITAVAATDEMGIWSVSNAGFRNILVSDARNALQLYTRTALSGTTPDIDMANGSVQTWTLTANSTPTESLVDGENVLLQIDDGSNYTITWPTMEWIGGSAPVLTGDVKTWVELWKTDTTLYGALVGYTG